MLPPNTVLNRRYTVVRQLGQGGMGAVYLATDQTFGSTVALKETLITDESLRRAFEREARLLNSLHHAALPHVFDYFFEGEGQFLVMQYIPGEDLGHQLKNTERPFPVDAVLRWADQLLDLLDYLHSHEPPIVHRDIKPENLKLTQRGEIILLDFGLAKGSVDRMTQVSTQSLFGYTPHYAPFEQIRGTGTDPRSDLYSLAATLFHLLTGKLPPDALSRAEAIMNGEPDPMGNLPGQLPMVSPQVAAVFAAALATRKENRFASAGAMREALRAAMQAPAPAPGAWQPQQPLASTMPTVPSNPQPSLPPTVAPERTPSSIWVFAALGVLLVLAAGVIAVIFLLPKWKETANVNNANANVAVRNATPLAKTATPNHVEPVGTVQAKGAVLGLAFSDGGNTLASTDDARTIALWDAATGTVLRAFGDGKTASRSVAFAPGGKLLAAGYDDGRVSIWRAEDGTPVRSLKAHDDFVFLVQFNADGSRVATAGGDRTVKVWNSGSGSEVADITSPDEDTLIICVSPDLDRVAFYDKSRGVSVWSVASGKRIAALANHNYELRTGAFSPDGKTLALGSTDGTLRLWNADTGAMVREIHAGGGAVLDVAWTPDGGTLATGAADGTLALWRAADGGTLQSLPGMKTGIKTLAFSGDGTALASGGADKTVRLWAVSEK